MNENGFPVLSDNAYQIVAELGEGGGGVVYQAWHTRLQKYVVLKRIKDESGLLQASRHRSEADILKNLKHANLPQLYDFLEDPSGVYTVMEFIPGQSFAELLKRGNIFPQPQVVRWAEQLSAALSYLHTQTPPVLHSDIKPGNIMLTTNGDVCLIDFNISLVLAGEGAEMLGMSHGYASPEQYGAQEAAHTMHQYVAQVQVNPAMTDIITDIADIETDYQINDSEVTELLQEVPVLQPVHSPPPLPPLHAQRRAAIHMDTRSDIYSIGATLYHMVTGEKPAIATGQIKPLSKFNVPLSKAFVYIIERCMARDPSKRFQTAADLHEAVRDIHKLDGRWKRHKLKAALTGAILSLLFVLSCAATFFGWQRMGAEAMEAYNGYVLEIAGEDGDSAYSSAIAIFPENPAAYRERALRLYRSGNHAECIAYIKTSVAKLSAYTQDAVGIKSIGELYYILGNAYFEMEDDLNSLAAYEVAIKNSPDNHDIYRDYAIALVRCGYINRAEDMLNAVSETNLGNDSIFLLRGEIAHAMGSDKDAISLLKSAIQETNSDYIRNRAYLICDKSYRRLPDLIDEEIALLQNALRELPANYSLLLKERLADAYVRAGEYDQAVQLLEEFRQSGNISFLTWQNIGVLYQKTGDFADARKVFLEMLATYPNDYRPSLRLAYLVLEEQNALPNEQRNYAEAVLHYEKAQALSVEGDMEMEMLSRLIGELNQGGWIVP